jgi:flagella basal body P-ring formation protein FlgA
VRLRPDAQLATRTVTLDAIAAIDSADEDRLRMLKSLRVASLGQPGQPLRLPRSRLRHLMDTALPALRDACALEGAASVLVTWSAMPLDLDALSAWTADALGAALKAREPQADLRIVPMGRPAAPAALPMGAVSYLLRPVALPLTSRMPAQVDILVDGRRAATVSAWFGVSGTMLAWRMRASAATGARLHADLLSAERIAIPDEPVAMPASGALNDFRLKTHKEAGTVLYATDLMRRKAIERGEQVAVRFARGAVAVEDRAVALGEGMAGGEVQLLNPRTRETYAATVLSDGTAEVK